MPRHPADIGGAPVNITLPVIKAKLMRQACPEEIAAGGVHHALWFARRTRSIKNEQRVFGPHWFGRASAINLGSSFMIPNVTPRRHGDRAAGRANGYDSFEARALECGHIDIDLQRYRLATATSLIGGNDESRIAILNPPSNRFRRESAKNNAMDRANSRAGKQCECGFGDHRHVDCYPVTFGNARCLHDVRKFTNFAVQLFVGKCL